MEKSRNSQLKRFLPQLKIIALILSQALTCSYMHVSKIPILWDEAGK